MKILTVAFSIACATSLAMVSYAKSHTKGAQALVEATQVAEQFTHARQVCESNERAADVESTAQAYPEIFLKIGPDDSRWTQARAAYVHYGVSTCVPQNIDDYVAEAVAMYEDALSEKELAEVNRFYASPAGKKYAAVSSAVSAKLNQRMHEESDQLRESGAKRLEAEMLRIGTGGNGGN